MGFNKGEYYMKIFNKSIIAVLLTAAALTGCGNSGEIPAEIPESSSKAEIPAVVATIPIEDRKEKVNQITKVDIEEGMEFEYHYRFVPEEATDISDDINLGLITVDGKEFDITELSNAYGEEEIQNIFGEQAGLYTTDKLIADGVFDDVYIATKGSPYHFRFLFGGNAGVEEVEVNQEKYGLTKSKGAYDFITVEYVNDWFIGLHAKSLAMNAPPSAVEQITINGEEKTFVDVVIGDPSPQFTPNNDKLITYTDKNIAVGGGTTFGDLVAMFGAEPTEVDVDLGTGDIFTYRNSAVTVGFVRGGKYLVPEFENRDFEDLSEEEINSLPIVAVYMWLNG